MPAGHPGFQNYSLLWWLQWWNEQIIKTSKKSNTSWSRKAKNWFPEISFVNFKHNLYLHSSNYLACRVKNGCVNVPSLSPSLQPNYANRNRCIWFHAEPYSPPLQASFVSSYILIPKWFGSKTWMLPLGIWGFGFRICLRLSFWYLLFPVYPA